MIALVAQLNTNHLPPTHRLLTAYLLPIDLLFTYLLQVIALVAQLDDVQRLRVRADESLRGVQSLVTTLQAENELLRQQNITIASEARQFLEDRRPAGL